MLQQTLQKYATGRNIFALFIITQIVYFIMLGITIPHVQGYADGMELFDVRPTGYDVDYAHELLTNLGDDGRDAYLYQQIPFDLVYPGLFAITYALMLTWIFRYSFGSNSKMNMLVFVPIAAGTFDYLENAGIVVMLLSYPNFSDAVVYVSSFFSLAKSLFTTVFFILLIVGIVAAAIKRFRANPIPTLVKNLQH